MARVLLAGAFGQGNPGDEALLAAFRAELPDLDAVATSADPRATASQHGIAAVPARDSRAVGRAIRASEAVVFAGGTVFKVLDPRSGRHPLALLANGLALASGARALGRPVAMVGVGAGTLPGGAGRLLVRRLVRSADLLVLRDEESAAALLAAGAPAPVRVGADPTWRLLGTPRGQTASGDAVVVALSRLAGGEDLAARLAEALRPAVAAGLRVRLQPWSCTGDLLDDRALAADVSRRLGAGAEVVTPPADLLDAVELFTGARLVLALRFHAMPAAAVAGVPMLAVDHEPKLAGLARRLRQPAVPAETPPERIAQALMAALDRPAPAPEAIHAEMSAAAEQFRLLRLLLRRGEAVHAEHGLTGLSLHPEEWVA